MELCQQLAWLARKQVQQTRLKFDIYSVPLIQVVSEDLLLFCCKYYALIASKSPVYLQ